MLKFITELLEKLSCKHKWKEYERWNINTELGGRYTKILFICEKCGKMKQYKSNPG